MTLAALAAAGAAQDVSRAVEIAIEMGRRMERGTFGPEPRPQAGGPRKTGPSPKALAEMVARREIAIDEHGQIIPGSHRPQWWAEHPEHAS